MSSSIPSAAGSRTGTLTITDNAQGSPQAVALSGTGQDFTMSAAFSAITISAGQSATYTLSLASGGGLNQTVTLACAGAPATVTCSVPANIALNGSSASKVTVTVSTTAPTMAPPGPPSHWPSWPTGVGISLAWLVALLASIGLAVIDWGYAARWPAPSRGVLACAALTLFVTFGTACGGSANVVHSPGTPAGTYTLTVTATVTSGSAALKHSANLGLTVQ